MKTLLIVDDDPGLLGSLSAVFRGIYHIQTAQSAEEAAGLLEHADILLLDVVLPGLDGVGFLKSIRKKNLQLPVVMISASSSIRPVLEALELGASDYIRKPFDIEELRLVVSRALQTNELQKRIARLERELASRPFKAEPDGRPMKELLEEFEKALIRKTLQRTDGVQTRAARELGTTRRILSYRIQKLSIACGADAPVCPTETAGCRS